MIVGLLFIAFIWCLRGFLSYKQVVHNSCNMGTRGLPDIYTLISPRACGPRALGIYQANHSCPCYNYTIYMRITHTYTCIPTYSTDTQNTQRHTHTHTHTSY